MSGAAARLSPGTAAADPLAGIEWQASLSAIAYGVRISVRTNDRGAAESLAAHLPPGAEPVPFSDGGRLYSFVVEADERSGTPRSAVYVDGALLARRPTLNEGLRAFEADVQIHVAEMAPERVFVHAAVVGYQGRAILLPGRSFAGKSTLVRELVRAGARYYSDEYAVLDSTGRVHPYPRPLAIRTEQAPGASKHHVDIGGAEAGGDPLPVGLVVMSEYRPGGVWRPRRLSPGRAALGLLANTVAARRVPDVALATLQQVVTRARVVASDRGEAATVVDAILALAASEPHPISSPQRHRDTEASASQSSARGTP